MSNHSSDLISRTAIMSGDPKFHYSIDKPADGLRSTKLAGQNNHLPLTADTILHFCLIHFLFVELFTINIITSSPREIWIKICNEKARGGKDKKMLLG